MENQYYAAKALKSDGDMKEALKTFKDVVATEQERGEKGDWGFKALKQMIKITFHQVDIIKIVFQRLFSIPGAV